MSDTSLRIAVHAGSDAEANRLTTELEQWLNSRVDGIKVVRVRENHEAQDAGTVLVAALSAPAAIALAKGPALELAKGVADWLRKRRANVTVGPDGAVSVENVDAETAERIILAILKRQQDETSE